MLSSQAEYSSEYAYAQVYAPDMERRGQERRKGKEKKGKERKGQERKGKERKGKEEGGDVKYI